MRKSNLIIVLFTALFALLAQAAAPSKNPGGACEDYAALEFQSLMDQGYAPAMHKTLEPKVELFVFAKDDTAKALLFIGVEGHPASDLFIKQGTCMAPDGQYVIWKATLGGKKA